MAGGVGAKGDEGHEGLGHGGGDVPGVSCAAGGDQSQADGSADAAGGLLPVGGGGRRHECRVRPAPLNDGDRQPLRAGQRKRLIGAARAALQALEMERFPDDILDNALRALLVDSRVEEREAATGEKFMVRIIPLQMVSKDVTALISS